MAKNDIEPRSVSGVELYELPDGWQWTDVGSIAEIINGKSQKEVEDDNGLYPIYGSGGIIGRARDFICPENCTIIGRKGTINNPIFVETKFWNVDTAFGMKPFDSVNPKFYFYFCKNFNFSTLDSSTAIPSLTKTNIQKIPFPLPSLPEQKRIVSRIESMFTKLDEARDKAQSVVDGFELRRAAILHKAFTGELTAKWRKEHGVSDDSWEEKTIGEILFNIEAGKNVKCESRPPENDEFGIVKVSSVTWGKFDELESKVCFDDSCFNENVLIKTGDFLFSRANTLQLVGNCVIVGDISKRLLLSDKILRFHFSNNIDSKFFLYFTRSMNYRSQVEDLASGNQDGMRNISQNNYKQVRFLLPTIPEQKEIVRILDTVLEKEADAKAAAERVLEQIALLKKSILARAFRGEL